MNALATRDAALSVKYQGRTYAVESLADASRKWQDFRMAAIMEGGGGGSQIGNGLTVRNAAGKIVGKVSYNGRLWDAQGQLIAEAS